MVLNTFQSRFLLLYRLYLFLFFFSRLLPLPLLTGKENKQKLIKAFLFKEFVRIFARMKDRKRLKRAKNENQLQISEINL